MRNDKLTEKQQAFVMALVTRACTATQAAVDAGFSAVSARQQASNLLSLKHVQEGIRAAQFQLLNSNLANVALATLHEVMTDKTAPAGARVTAAVATLERSGLHHDIEAKNIAEVNKSLNAMSREELEALIRASEHFLKGESAEKNITLTD